MSVKDVLVQIWHAVIACRHMRQERERPGKARAKNDVVYSQLGGAVLKMHRAVAVAAGDVRNGRPSLDLGVFERFIAEIHVVATPDHGMDGYLCTVYQAHCGICGGDRGADGDDFLWMVRAQQLNS